MARSPLTWQLNQSLTNKQGQLLCGPCALELRIPGVAVALARLEAHLGEVDGEDGVRAAAGVVHARGGCGAVDVARLHQLLHVMIVLHQVLG